jgi:hypothetical protein
MHHHATRPLPPGGIINNSKMSVAFEVKTIAPGTIDNRTQQCVFQVSHAPFLFLFLSLFEGDGTKAPHGRQVNVHYTGWLRNQDGSKGAKFDSSLDRGRPFSFTPGAGQVIRGIRWFVSFLARDYFACVCACVFFFMSGPLIIRRISVSFILICFCSVGWDEGVPRMTRGEKALITCPPGYLLYSLSLLDTHPLTQTLAMARGGLATLFLPTPRSFYAHRLIITVHEFKMFLALVRSPIAQLVMIF